MGGFGVWGVGSRGKRPRLGAVYLWEVLCARRKAFNETWFRATGTGEPAIACHPKRRHAQLSEVHTRCKRRERAPRLLTHEAHRKAVADDR